MGRADISHWELAPRSTSVKRSARKASCGDASSEMPARVSAGKVATWRCHESDEAHEAPAIPLTGQPSFGYFRAARALHLLDSGFAVQPTMETPTMSSRRVIDEE